LDLELTEEQQLLQKSVREFAESEVRPLAKELDETGHFPRALFKKAAEIGLTGVALPEAEGGAGFDHIAYSIVIEEILSAGQGVMNPVTQFMGHGGNVTEPNFRIISTPISLKSINLSRFKRRRLFCGV